MVFLIDDLIGDLLKIPLDLSLEVLDKIADMAEDEYSSPAKIKDLLMELQLKLEMDEISEEEYAEAEKSLLARLEEGTDREERGAE
ncbi:MAG: gas vesicle protein GvpG [Coprothermobacterota bacterium]|nr:gas vesicle protein GvpG [Coprothermobacterota bacterium]